jgi:hypothetical protein
MERVRSSLRLICAAVLLVQANGVFFVGLFSLLPGSRPTLYFVDLVLFCGGGAAAALGLLCRRPWARLALFIHAAAALHAAVTCLRGSMLTGDAWPLTVVLAPSFLVIPGALWVLWPRLSSDHELKGDN